MDNEQHGLSGVVSIETVRGIVALVRCFGRPEAHVRRRRVDNVPSGGLAKLHHPPGTMNLPSITIDVHSSKGFPSLIGIVNFGIIWIRQGHSLRRREVIPTEWCSSIFGRPAQASDETRKLDRVIVLGSIPR